MADTDKNQDADGTDEPIAVPRKSMLPIIIGAVAVVLGGIGAYILTRPAPKAAAKEARHSTAPAEDGEAGPIVALSPFIVNLADEDQVSYLKCTLALEVPDKEWAATLEKKMPPVRNAVILYLSSLLLAETRGTKNKEKILGELSTRIADVIGKDGVRRVYLNEFVIQ